tara:strand:+ start:230 stop:424 length:195 start_codon:yes stop_codon:yes gene_type:complete
MIRDIRPQGIRYSPINILGVSIPKRRGLIRDLVGYINQILFKLVWISLIIHLIDIYPLWGRAIN